MLSQTGGHGDGTEVWSEGSGPVSGGCCGGSHGGIGASALGRVVDGVPECIKATRDNMRKGANHIKVCVCPPNCILNFHIYYGEEAANAI